MANACKVCYHPDKAAIEEEIVAGRPARQIALHYELSQHTIGRHRSGHMSSSIIAMRQREQRRAISLHDRVDDLMARVEKVVETAEASGGTKTFLSAVKEMRNLLELYGRLTGELDTRPQVQVLNVSTSPEWLAVRAALLTALAPYPEARQAVTGALLELEARKEQAG